MERAKAGIKRFSKELATASESTTFHMGLAVLRKSHTRHEGHRRVLACIRQMLLEGTENGPAQTAELWGRAGPKLG